ncbi:MAG: hypothetical protein GY696_23455 [Gammaproteobacteria bacterium]|nr:hypothetical protein [Gammaproteobacteria bacterium]
MKLCDPFINTSNCLFHIPFHSVCTILKVCKKWRI